MRPPRRSSPISIVAVPSPRFQIAPMIDIVFVIMLFFMVMAGQMRAERELSQRLPGCSITTEEIMPIEVALHIDTDGMVALNDEALDANEAKRLTNTRLTLHRLKQQSASDGGKILITIEAEPDASYERIMDVLNVLSSEHLQDVTFTVADD